MEATTPVNGQESACPPPAAVLLNPGPVNVHERVRAAMTYPDVCHREPEAAALMRRTRAKATAVCGGDENHTSVLLAGSGTAALEAAVSSVVPRDGKILVLDNGNYGERIHRIVTVHGIPEHHLEFGWMNPMDPAAVDAVLAADPQITHVGMVHHETSTGMLNPLREIGEVVARHGRSLLVDGISSVGAEEFDMAADHVDWLVGTANKCLEGLPGVSFVCARRDRLEALADVPSRTFYLDLHGHYVAQDKVGAPLFTPAVQVMYAFEEALDLMLAEGVGERIARYTDFARRLRAGFAERGLRFLLPEEQMSTSVTNVHVPDGVRYADLHDLLKDEGFVIYGVQEQVGNVFRVANMGQLATDVPDVFLAALDRVLGKLGAAGVAA
ncbi:2-aminoethylphosphonate aminotransferase [Streptomyces sp. KLMMK]|uniref:2-aminoethylphosphonate--pyruvate transaminase n=1 Tax=Streptomyces telluris TaxID=2720021 RepID=A0A9X2LME4_9ACTN|nr:2-aminoethylphosphonate aminotransferase [Streptomyces telluris]MCQ8773903.1 2-aminoethylphosphonate aminotransferase [Streptomyces telluris]NJP77685.1 2-aminoethylphosphonate aminotransferase [Streptomyces telluris]